MNKKYPEIKSIWSNFCAPMNARHSEEEFQLLFRTINGLCFEILECVSFELRFHFLQISCRFLTNLLICRRLCMCVTVFNFSGVMYFKNIFVRVQLLYNIVLFSAISQKQKNECHILMHICGMQKNGTDEPICNAHNF